MLEKILRFTEKLIPKKLYQMGQPFYHFGLALTGAILYGFPGRKIKIIGVTGTKGKSTTVEIINSILEQAGYKTAVLGTIRFKVGENERPNKFKMSMPGRFFMQKFLSDAVKAKCDFVVVELTSEGSKQFRHKYIYLDALVFTNLSPEHIEAHGSFEKYKKAKLNIVDNLKKKSGLLVVNKEDEHAGSFQSRSKNNTGYSISETHIKSESPIEFAYKDLNIQSPLIGMFNIENILGAIEAVRHFKISNQDIIEGIKNLNEVKGRVQFIENNRNIDIVVDYAHTIESLESLYKAFESKRKVCVFGNTGGGRDKWKRKGMAEVANKYCDEIILTNEDPYDEDPVQIVNDMKEGIDSEKLEIEIDRKKAIKMAINKAFPGSAVLITGKGTDPYIMEANGQKTPWSDAGTVQEVLSETI
jgi:UDP-N-acetylmuramoyl-L-alanyl-D-glutamate--2,6-diaminopimelate ligase